MNSMTIGEKIEQTVDEYFKLYKSLKEQGHDAPVGMAKYDLTIQKYIAERSLEGLTKSIEGYEKAIAGEGGGQNG